MPKLPIFLPNRDLDSTSLDNQLEFLQDGWIDFSGAIHKRPGYEEFADSVESVGIDGIHWWDSKEVVIVVTGGKVFKITDQFGTISEITSDTLEVGIPVTFAEALNGSDLLLIMANGGRMTYIDDGVSTTTYIADADAPTTVTHVAFIDTYVVANLTGSSSWYYSNPNLPLTWDVADSYDAEMEPDDIQGLIEFNRRIYIFGKRSIEPWISQSVAGDPFRRLDSAFLIPFGCFNRDLFAKEGDKLYFMDQFRRLMSIDTGGRLTLESQQYARFLQEELNSVTDGKMITMNVKGHELVLLSFESDETTLVFDNTVKAWYQWGKYSESGYDIYNGICHTYSPKWNKHLLGDFADGVVHELTENGYTDDGDSIRMILRTGWNGWDRDGEMKNSRGLLARLKRGVGLDGLAYTSGNLQIRFRDNGNQSWSDWKTIDLGEVGDTEMIRHLYRGRGGKYFTRQYEILSAYATPVVISGIWEDVIDTRPNI